MFAFFTFNFWEQMFNFQRYIRLSLKLILKPGRHQSLSPEINPINNAEPCCPHDKNVGSHLWDECMN